MARGEEAALLFYLELVSFLGSICFWVVVVPFVAAMHVSQVSV